MIIFVMGVAGCGKSTVGQKLAEKLNCPYEEADQHHSQSNRSKMRSGLALTDQDRLPWLETLNQIANQYQTINQSAVISCSALKIDYRQILIRNLKNVKFVWLKVSFEAAEIRLKSRPDHYFKPDLLKSQFECLQSPMNDKADYEVIEIDACEPIHSILDTLIKTFSSYT